MLSDTAKDELLRIARASISARLSGKEFDAPDPTDPLLSEHRGAFVTLEKRGRLRGCIGRMESEAPLWKLIGEMACAAAFEDPRFPAVEADELDALHIEISALTPYEKVTDPERIEVGRHGLMVSDGVYRGVLLPQVAVEHGWDRDRFLDETCAKAGLAAGAWRDPKTDVFTFTAEVFGEGDAT